MIARLKSKIIRWALNQIRKMSIGKLSYLELGCYGIEDIITNKATSNDPVKLYLPKNEIAIIIKKELPK